MTALESSVRPTMRAPAQIRFGCCTNMVGTAADPLGAAAIETLARLGFDYVDLSLRDLVALPDSGRDELQRRLSAAGIPCEACNNFLPVDVRLTGPAADLGAAQRYIERALAVAKAFGVSVVVFGSAGSRNVPDGFPFDVAWRQLREMLTMLGPRAQAHGITIALEHLCRLESNILNTIGECRRLEQEVGHPNILLLVDCYHLLRENEAPAIIEELRASVAHVHVAEGTARLYPSGHDAFLAECFGHLRAGNYTGRASIEANTRDFPAEAARALQACRALARGT